MFTVIGVDGGATHTSAALADDEGCVLARAAGPSVSPYLHTSGEVLARLRGLTEALRRDSGVENHQVAGLCLGVSGCDRPKDRASMEAVGERLFPKARVVATNDALIALVGGLGRLDGIVTISGTGSIAYGFTPDGRSRRSGGHGHWLGDEGGGFEIARRGLVAVMRAHDGRGPSTGLTDAVLANLELQDPNEIKGWMRENGPDKAAVAGMAQLVFAAAETGDQVAREIVDWAADELALATMAVADGLWPGSEPVNVVVGGANLRHQRALFDRFEKAVRGSRPAAEVMQPRSEPVDGAVNYMLHVLATESTVG